MIAKDKQKPPEPEPAVEEESDEEVVEEVIRHRPSRVTWSTEEDILLLQYIAQHLKPDNSLVFEKVPVSTVGISKKYFINSI